jgi:hypothetical protein
MWSSWNTGGVDDHARMQEYPTFITITKRHCVLCACVVCVAEYSAYLEHSLDVLPHLKGGRQRRCDLSCSESKLMIVLVYID